MTQPTHLSIEKWPAFPQCDGMKRILVLTLLACALALAGCKQAPDAAPVASAPTMPTHAQPKLRTIKLWIGAQEMVTEIAVTAEQEQTGMMFRTNMAENEGMIFAFVRPMRASFWMKNTVLPLSAAYIAPGGAILEIHDLQPLDTNAVVAASDNIQYVLETPQGWFKRNNVNVNTVITTENGPLHKVFFGR
jgi:uncharacterized membrane protein (UPF0127 family)